MIVLVDRDPAHAEQIRTTLSYAVDSFFIDHKKTFTLGLLESFNHAIQVGARIVCCPVGSPGHLRQLDAAVLALRGHGILLIAAIGNDGAGKLRSPAACPWALSVGALPETKEDGRAAGYSGSGFIQNDAIHPSRPHLWMDGSGPEGALGTSFSCAHATNLAANLFQEGLAGEAVIERLTGIRSPFYPPPDVSKPEIEGHADQVISGLHARQVKPWIEPRLAKLLGRKAPIEALIGLRRGSQIAEVERQLNELGINVQAFPLLNSLIIRGSPDQLKRISRCSSIESIGDTDTARLPDFWSDMLPNTNSNQQ